MAAFIPSRRDREVNERALAKVREDKEREAGDGFDGSWVAHPDLVPVCREVFDRVLGDRPNQLDRRRDDVQVSAEHLLDVAAIPGRPTEAGLRSNVDVGLRYVEAWLRGNGAVGIHNLMEDAATAEISRSQIWQWIHNETRLDTGGTVTPELVRTVLDEVLAAVRDEVGADAYAGGRFEQAREIFERVALGDDFVDFLTLPAYETVLATESAAE
jgi:malate synthase